MIFKTLFTPGHKQADPEKRKASIDKLDPSKESDKRILHELAFNDASDSVSLAALSKLDSFVLWMKSVETSQSGMIKKRAEQVCIEALEHTDTVSDSLFEAFVSESKNKSMLNTLLFSSKRLQQHKTLSLTVLWGLTNEQATRRFFAEIASESQQLQIVELTQDAKLLTKYSKQTRHQSVIDLIDEKAKVAELAKLMPAKVKHVVTLINSRLLALKESHDYAYLNQEFAKLNDEFEQAKADFVYLDELSSAQLSEKYLQLKASISGKIANLAEQYKEHLALNKTTDDLSDLQERLKDVEQQVNLLLSSDEPEIDSQVKILSGSVQSTQEEMDLLLNAVQTIEHKQLITALQSHIAKMNASLQDLPGVINASQQVQILVQQLNTSMESQAGKEKLKVDELASLENLINDTKTAFEQLKRENSLLPAVKIKEFMLTLAKVNRQLKSFKGYYHNLERKCENKLKVVDRMIADGKFKPAMSTFYHVQKLIDSLPEAIENSRNSRLVKAYASTSEEVQKLQDWQAYIAQPRKPALLEDTIQLANSEMDDAYGRVDTVKQLRAQWQSFGSLHTEEDDALNKAFDESIEKAFAPCRVFFASLEKLREENRQIAQGIIDEVSTIDDETPATDLASLVGGLKSRFNKIGEIDKSELSKVKRRFAKVIEPLNKKVKAFYAANALQKEKLVERASKLRIIEETSDSLQEAAEQAKTLQKQWKAIGFAGKNKENQLWQAFREQNDQLFNRYHEFLNEGKAQTEQILQTLEGKVVELGKKVNSAESQADLSFYVEAYQELEQNINDIDDKAKQKIKNKLHKLDESYQQKSKNLDSAKTDQDTQKLFDFLKEYTEKNMPASFESLVGRYKTWVKGDLKPIQVLQGLSREELVQVALIVSDSTLKNIEFGDENRRKKLQMLLMAAKLQGNEVVLPESVLAAWVGQNHVSPEDVDGLLLLEKLFTTKA